jgi:hypothetical protein
MSKFLKKVRKFFVELFKLAGVLFMKLLGFPRRLIEKLPKLLVKLPKRFQWTLHNIVGRPLSEVVWQFGLHKFSDWIHVVTALEDSPKDR